MSQWGTVHNANSYPKFLDGMTGAGYANNFANGVAGVWGVNDARASGKPYHKGWVYAERGTGPLKDFTITNPGTQYTNSDTWVAGSASGTVGVDANGAIISVFVEDGGSFSSTNAVPLVITSEDGTGAVISAVPGGRAGRVKYETLVTTSVMTAANNAYTNMP